MHYCPPLPQHIRIFILMTDEYRLKLKEAFEKIPGVIIPDERIKKYPTFLLDFLANDDNYNKYINILKVYIEDIKNSEQ